MSRLSILGSLLGLAALQGCSCNGPTVAHSGEDPLYPLSGLHAAVPCASCHGSGTPKSVSRLCIDCHEADRPSPDHNPGEECGACHNELPPAWLNGVNTAPTTGDTGVTILPTGDTGTIIITEPDPIHDGLSLDTMCMSSGCHDAASGDRKDAEHYANPANPQKDWDCGSCHETGLPGTGWLVNVIIHPARTPHGTYFQNDAVPEDSGRWVVGCDKCHQDLNDYTQFMCSNCHNGAGALPALVDLWANGKHFGFDPGTEADEACLGCHYYADVEFPP